MSVFIVEMWEAHDHTEIFGVYSNLITAEHAQRLAKQLREFASIREFPVDGGQ